MTQSTQDLRRRLDAVLRILAPVAPELEEWCGDAGAERAASRGSTPEGDREAAMLIARAHVVAAAIRELCGETAGGQNRFLLRTRARDASECPRCGRILQPGSDAVLFLGPAGVPRGPWHPSCIDEFEEGQSGGADPAVIVRAVLDFAEAHAVKVEALDVQDDAPENGGPVTRPGTFAFWLGDHYCLVRQNREDGTRREWPRRRAAQHDAD